VSAGGRGGDALLAERAAALAQIEALTREFDGVVAALARREAGDYGICASCGRPIAPERLAARPAARTCIDCAR
jgi:DnaK suppressor protein